MAQADTKDLQNLYQALNGQFLPRSAQIAKHVRQFLKEQISDFEKWNRNSEGTLEKLRTEEGKYNKIMVEIKQKMNKDGKFKEGADHFLKAKDDEIHMKNKSLESINNGLKESVTKVSPKKLADLPYKNDPIYQDIFSTLFVVLYHKPKQQFVWKDFKSLALEKDDGQDFITRLANINFREMNQEHYNLLRMLNGQQKFKDITQNSEHAVNIVDLADWLAYVIEGHKITLEKKQSQHEYGKIRKDLDARYGSGLSVKEDFCKQTLRELDGYQTNLMNYQAELRTLMVGMKNGLEDIDELQKQRNAQIEKLNAV